VLEDEASSELEAPTARLLDELGAVTELEARLVRHTARSTEIGHFPLRPFPNKRENSGWDWP
jgi:hypothetical protein